VPNGMTNQTINSRKKMNCEEKLDYDQLVIAETAFEEMIEVMKSQEKEFGEMEFSLALESVSIKHNLSRDQQDEVVRLYDEQNLEDWE